MNNEWRSCGTTTSRRMRVNRTVTSFFILSFSFALSLSLSLSFSLFTLSLISLAHSPPPSPRTYENAFAIRARHTSWLLIHVAADYFPASLWHQIPYSSQNGESVSPRARWSMRTSDSHRILTPLFTRPLLSSKYFLAADFVLDDSDPLSPWQKFDNEGEFYRLYIFDINNKERFLSIVFNFEWSIYIFRLISDQSFFFDVGPR